ncbi:MAG: acetyltransferase [Streptococcaceae bacterium]|jgi:peptidoglycan/LPS O-acetylase OafA/YrhL|nr:acetyltransferase [Streptococcaceae bacterium]
MKNNTGSSYIFGIDALRSLGLFGVIFYHIAPKFLSGGYLAVLIFFVLTGFLLTRSLLIEQQNHQKIDWKSFFVKRLKRIYPLMLAIFLLIACFFILFQPKMLTGMRGSFLSSLFSVNNWWQIADGSSYFANFAQSANNAFKHIYFLSIEGQFSLILAILMLFLPKFREKKIPVILLIVLSLLSAADMVVFYNASDPTRVYYGTDSRIFALLIGSALAFLDSSKIKLKTEVVKPLALIALLAIIESMVFLNDKSEFVYRGGMYLFSLLAAFIIWTLSERHLGENRFLSNRIFNYLGSRSYGIYLWQLPVFCILENWRIDTSAWQNIIWELILILLLSEASYRLIEKPFSKLTFKQIKDFFTGNMTSLRKLPVYTLIIAVAASLVIILSSPAQSMDIKKLEKKISENKIEADGRNRQLIVNARNSSKKGSSGEKVKPSASQPLSTAPSASNSPKTAEAPIPVDPSNYPMVAVGDSVMLDVAQRLQQGFPQLYLDGQVGRQASAGVSALQSIAPGVLNAAKAILIDLGVNGEIDESDISGIMKISAGRPVFWVNVRVPRSWEAEDNAVLAMAAKNYPNLHVLDWHSIAVNHPEYFVSDQVHLTNAGITAYVQLITLAVLAQ